MTILAVMCAYFLGSFPLSYVIANSPVDPNVELTELLGTGLNRIPSHWRVALLVLPHLAALLALMLCIRFVHHRGIRTAMTSRTKFSIGRAAMGFILWAALTGVAEVGMFFLTDANYSFEFHVVEWIPLLLVALLLLPLQSGFEELFVRGYLLQGVGLATHSRLIALVVTSLLFVALHMQNPEVEQFGRPSMILYYALVALFLGALTLMDEGLELAIGVHAATNIYGAAFVTFDGSVLDTNAMFSVSDPNAISMIAAFVATAILFYVIVDKAFNLKGLKSLTFRTTSNEQNE